MWGMRGPNEGREKWDPTLGPFKALWLSIYQASPIQAEGCYGGGDKYHCRDPMLRDITRLVDDKFPIDKINR
jgi:hypothetical protein